MSSDDLADWKRSCVDLDVIVGTHASEEAVRTVSRRYPGHLILSVNPRVIGMDGLIVRMQPDPYRILAALISRRGMLLTREELAEILWSHRADGGPLDRCIDVQMQAVKAAAAALGIIIERQWGIGWRAFKLSAPIAASVAAE